MTTNLNRLARSIASILGSIAVFVALLMTFVSAADRHRLNAEIRGLRIEVKDMKSEMWRCKCHQRPSHLPTNVTSR